MAPRYEIPSDNNAAFSPSSEYDDKTSTRVFQMYDEGILILMPMDTTHEEEQDSHHSISATVLRGHRVPSQVHSRNQETITSVNLDSLWNNGTASNRQEESNDDNLHWIKRCDAFDEDEMDDVDHLSDFMICRCDAFDVWDDESIRNSNEFNMSYLEHYIIQQKDREAEDDHTFPGISRSDAFDENDGF